MLCLLQFFGAGLEQLSSSTEPFLRQVSRAALSETKDEKRHRRLKEGRDWSPRIRTRTAQERVASGL